MLPKIEKKRCVACGACISACPAGVFEPTLDKPAIVKPSACTGCKVCALNCPNGAISFARRTK
jgi:NAD-dependent dihydropyrimidine dehydrogenase PreA subunit